MKFLIQKINGKVFHDFSIALLNAIEYHDWCNPNDKIIVKYCNTIPTNTITFNSIHSKYTPIGSVEFVSAFLLQFYSIVPKPINVPVELFPFAGREINNYLGEIPFIEGKFFLKSNEVIKSPINGVKSFELFKGKYQVSRLIDIDSEWRGFVFEGKLVGLQNYLGDFTIFPDVNMINNMITAYTQAPIAYTLDAGVTANGSTVVIECHEFHSCAFYGFSDYTLIPRMCHRWFRQYIKTNNIK